MKQCNLRSREVDLLDKLNELRYQRRLSYEANTIDRTNELNHEIKTLRLRMGWSETDAQSELNEAIKEFERAYTPPPENPFIKYDLNDENGNPRGLSLSIHQVSRYWNRRDGGLNHAEALCLAMK